MRLPNLTNEKLLALDIETKDPNLKELGPGVRRAVAGLEDGYILDVSISTWDKDWAWQWSDNLKIWLSDLFKVTTIEWIGANAMYDFDWLQYFSGVPVGRIWDILTNESLIDGGRNFYSLDSVALRRLGEGKADEELEEYCRIQGWKGDPRAHLWKMPPELRHPYAKMDTRKTYDVYQDQLIDLQRMDLMRVAELEADFNHVMLLMRKNGVKLDFNRMDETREYAIARATQLREKLNAWAGFTVNVARSADLKRLFEEKSLEYPLTAKGNPSFTKNNLHDIEVPEIQIINDIRFLDKLDATYFQNFEKFAVNGRLHTIFHPVKNGNRGAETGRLSATMPALQTIPTRGEGKKLMRRLFIPEEGHIWEKQDQSQEEYRIFAHYARGGGAAELRYNYATDPDMDMHQFVADYVGVSRGEAKSLNFGSLYGMGVHKFSRQLGLPVPLPWPDRRRYAEENEFFDDLKEHKEFIKNNYQAGKLYYGYHGQFACVKETEKAAKQAAEKRGYALTILGRRRYLRGDETFKALNSTIQGTGADIMKLWMVQCYKEGLYTDDFRPTLSIHDEQDISRPDTSEGDAKAKELQRIGETCIELYAPGRVTAIVPLKVDREIGPNWGDLESVNE